MTDVVIIGAGPAGSLAAILLARVGKSVILVEQHRFPRDKVCGECLSALGVEVLGRHQLLQPLLALGAVWLTRATFHAGDAQPFAIELSMPMLGVSRLAQDTFLLEQARRAGARTFQPARCEAVFRSPTGVTVRIRDLETNALADTQATFVIVADGKSALPARAPAATGEFGIKCHWSGVKEPRDTIELFACDGCYGGLAPIEQGRWNTAFAIPATRLKSHRGNFAAAFDQLRHENPHLRSRLAGASQISPWIASPLPRFAVLKNWPSGIIPVGNAASAIDPIGGDGMGLALRSAELAAHAIAIAPPRDRDLPNLRRAYARVWRTPTLLCRAAAVVASSPRLTHASLPILSALGGLPNSALHLLGK